MQRLAGGWQRQGVSVGLVPTMGCLHAGHLSLLQRARRAIGGRGRLVASIYVNPTQFGAQEDFSRYPRSFRRDCALCRREGVDVVFAPTDAQMYPRRGSDVFSTFVVEEELSRGMEGQSRPTHFRGVCTIVAKLFNIVRPQVAVFGEKDYQQAAVVKRMVRDLNFPVKILVAPIFREPDGLAMSSRNQYLKGELRVQATILWRVIQSAKAQLRRSQRNLAAAGLKAGLRKMIQDESGVRLDYLEFFDPLTLEPVTVVRPGVHLALAAFIGRTRLIDNVRL
jgi:pantoate--beta-alanine ligase